MAAPDFSREARLLTDGHAVVAGADEAGRGPLAGPVVAAAVAFPDEQTARSIPQLNDSKRLSPIQRDAVYDALLVGGASHAVARIDPPEIDLINILQAALKAMATAAMSLDPPPDILLVDGNQSPTRHFTRRGPRIETVVNGDALSLSIAAASVIAKVTRDRIMIEYDAKYPGYGFASHKGYPSVAHRQAIVERGVCPIHRRSFRGVREYCGDGAFV